MDQESLNIFNKTYVLKAKFLAPIIGRFIISNIEKENKKMELVELYEPEIFYILNKKLKILWNKEKKMLN